MPTPKIVTEEVLNRARTSFYGLKDLYGMKDRRTIQALDKLKGLERMKKRSDDEQKRAT